MEKLTQKEFVVSQLNQFNEVSRNFCIKNYITRLASIIAILKKEGWIFNAHDRGTVYGNDYVYEVVQKPGDKTLF